MKVQRLTLRNFRNVREATFHPDPQVNFLVGANGQGKTSFLEAIGYLATLRSFRGSKSAEAVNWESSDAEIVCTLGTDMPPGMATGLPDFTTELKVTFAVMEPVARKTRKLAFINGKPFRSSTQYLSQRFGSFELGFHAIVFNPADHDLVRGEPGERRSYLDRVLAAEDVDYLETVQTFQRVLEQRNSVLKSEQRGASDLLAGFTEPMARLAAQLAYKRLQYIQRLVGTLDAHVHEIAPKQPDLRLFYLSNWVPPTDGLSIQNNSLGWQHFAGHAELPSIELLEQAFWNKLKELESAEWRVGHSLVGPHRDDWAFYIGGQLLKGHGSQGEVRSALLALKLSEIELFRNTTGHQPLFLLDDFSSELDRDRRSFLLDFLSRTDLQVFVTTTEDTTFIGRRYFVMNGGIQEREYPQAENTPKGLRENLDEQSRLAKHTG